MANKKEWHSHIYKSVLLYSIDTETKLDIYSFKSAITTFHKSGSAVLLIRIYYIKCIFDICMDFRDGLSYIESPEYRSYAQRESFSSSVGSLFLPFAEPFSGYRRGKKSKKERKV